MMIDLHDKQHRPTLDELGEAIRNPLFGQFCTELQTRYGCRERIEFSACSMEPGWNLKFKKAGRSLCTIYPRESYFTVMAVVGRKEKERLEAILPDCTPQMQEIYHSTREGNGQRWLMIDLEDHGGLYRDVFRLLDIRST